VKWTMIIQKIEVTLRINFIMLEMSNTHGAVSSIKLSKKE